MHSRAFILGLGLSFFVGCALAPEPRPAAEREIAVPSALADRFAVKHQDEVAPPAPAPSLPAPVAKGKKAAKDRKASTGKASPAKADFTWPNRWPMPAFFRTGETYLFDITYFGATAGELALELLPIKVVADRPVYHLRANARTASVFSLFYRMNDVAESFLDVESLVSHKFTLKLDESLQTRDMLELYDQRAQRVYYWSKLDHKKKGKKDEEFEISSAPFTQDGLSAFFYIRTLPLKDGDVYEFPVVNNGKLRNVRVSVVRRENIKTKIGVRAAVVLKPEVVLDGAIKTYGDNFVWISDDAERVILKVDAKIKVGSIIAYLREHRYGAAKP